MAAALNFAPRIPAPARPAERSARPGSVRPRSDRSGSDRSGSDRFGSDRFGSDRFGSDRYDIRPVESTQRSRHHFHREPPAVYLRRRIAVGVVLVVIGALVWTIAGAVMGIGDRAAAGPVSASEPGDTSTYVVEPGDTLWSIASSMDVDGDIRRLVDELAALNGGSGLQVGQVIELPSG